MYACISKLYVCMYVCRPYILIHAYIQVFGWCNLLCLSYKKWWKADWHIWGQISILNIKCFGQTSVKKKYISKTFSRCQEIGNEPEMNAGCHIDLFVYIDPWTLKLFDSSWYSSKPIMAHTATRLFSYKFEI